MSKKREKSPHFLNHELFPPASFRDALEAAVKAIGKKRAAALCWPGLTETTSPKALASRLNNCLDPTRPQKLDPDQIEIIMRMARAMDCHAFAQFMEVELDYDMRPVPKQERDMQLLEKLLEQNERNARDIRALKQRLQEYQ